MVASITNWVSWLYAPRAGDEAKGAEMLRAAALRRENLDPVVEEIHRALAFKSNHSHTSWTLAGALIRHYLNTRSRTGMERLLQNPDEKIVRQTIFALESFARRRIHRPFVLPILAACMFLKNEQVCRNVFEIVRMALYTRTMRAVSLAELECMQQGVEQAFDSMQKNSRATSPDTLRFALEQRENATRLLQKITIRKARFAKRKDGELLVGETIKLSCTSLKVVPVLRRCL